MYGGDGELKVVDADGAIFKTKRTVQLVEWSSTGFGFRSNCERPRVCKGKRGECDAMSVFSSRHRNKFDLKDTP